MNQRPPVFGPRTRRLDIDQLVGPEAIMGVKVDCMIQTGHDLHTRRRPRPRVISDSEQAKVRLVDGQWTVHDMVVGEIYHAEQVREGSRRCLDWRIDLRDNRRHGCALIRRDY